MINQERLLATLFDLIRIDSPSGEEEEMARHVSGKLESMGFSVERDDYRNVIARRGEGTPLILSAHIDTVEPGRGIQPRIEGDRIVSDGTTILGGDCKAGVAAILEGLESVLEDGGETIALEVILTREEEIGLMGARKLDLAKVRGKEAVVFDGVGPASQIMSASPTYVGFDIDITGRAAHAGLEPEKGVSAVRIAGEIITRLPNGRLNDETTFNIGKMEGGQVRNAVPEKGTLVGEFRSRDPEQIVKLGLEVETVVEQVRKLFPDAAVEFVMDTHFHGYELTEKDPAVKRVASALRGLGLEPDLQVSGGGTDGNVFRSHGLSAAVVGMADYNAHTKKEYVVIPELVDAARLCEALVRGQGV